MQIKSNELVRYSFKGPGHGRKSFTIYEDIKIRGGGGRRCKKVEDERLIAINKSFQLGTQTHEQCVVLIKEIVKDLYKKDHRCRKNINIHNSENWKVFEDYWEQVYSFRPLINEISAINELKRAIESIGKLSIYSASREEIQTCVDKKYSGNTQRRVVARLTQILKFIGRDNVKLRKQPKDFIKVSYLNENEFRKILSVVPTEIEKSLLQLCYYSGLRIGEAYGLESHHLLPNGTIRVAGQLDRNGVRRNTKTKKLRLAYLFPDGIKAFNYWTQASEEEKLIINRDESSRELMKKYCKIAFPNDSTKHLTFHALRHCYAINLLNRGISMSLVAQSLGNTLSVCQQYYVGFVLTDDSIEAIHAIIKKNSTEL